MDNKVLMQPGVTLTTAFNEIELDSVVEEDEKQLNQMDANTKVDAFADSDQLKHHEVVKEFDEKLSNLFSDKSPKKRDTTHFDSTIVDAMRQTDFVGKKMVDESNRSVGNNDTKTLFSDLHEDDIKSTKIYKDDEDEPDH